MLPCSVRPSGSESLPGVETPNAATYEDVSTCAVTDFQVLDSIPEQAPLDGGFPSHLFLVFILGGRFAYNFSFC